MTGKTKAAFCLMTLILCRAVALSAQVQTGNLSPTSEQISIQPAIGEPYRELSPEQRMMFYRGKLAFLHTFTEAEGNGPIFNNASCATCHRGPAVGGAHQGLSMNVTRAGRVGPDGTFDPLTALGGSLFQRNGVYHGPLYCGESIPPEANHRVERRPTMMFGDGLVELLPAQAFKQKTSRYGTFGPSGRPHWVQVLETASGNRLPGRFGVKAQHATLLSFSADAALNELGITNLLFPHENAPNGDPERLAQCDDGVADPDDAPSPGQKRFIEKVTDFVRLLAPPPQTPKSGMRGESIFSNIGCADCHVPTQKTAPRPATTNQSFAFLFDRQFKPYSDFLLHDMGISEFPGFGSIGLSDGIPQGEAGRWEMMTPPLWGIAHRSMLGHDGMQGDLENVIRLHGRTGSEAAPSAQAYLALSQSDRDSVKQFLDSLGRREFDYPRWDRVDNKIDNWDFQSYRQCAANGGGPYTPDHLCAVFDINTDRIVNTSDLSFMAQVYEGSVRDCDCNSQLDLLEIASGSASDNDHNGIMDSCSMREGLDMYPDPREPGDEVTLSYNNCRPGDLIAFYAGIREQAHVIEGGRCINIADQVFLGTTSCSSYGWASVSFEIPPEVLPWEILVQAYNVTTGMKSSLVRADP